MSNRRIVKHFRLLMKNLFIVLVVLSGLIFAQRDRQGNFRQSDFSGRIYGYVIDDQTNKPIEYANISVSRANDSTIATGSISDAKGYFNIDKVPPGRYYLNITYIGYEQKKIDSVFINPRNLEFNAGEVRLQNKSILLGNVVITGEKDAFVDNIDKRVINVDKDLTSVGGTAVDVLQNVPSVSVDIEGNISLRGNRNVTILIDGKPATFPGLTPGDVLSQIPSSQIELVEVITNPSARYDPEGTSGIINIVMKKKIEIGLNGLISANLGTKDKYNSSINLNYKSGKFNFFGSYDTRFNTMFGNGTSTRTTTFNNVTTVLNQQNDSRFKMKSHNVNVGTDYYFDDKTSLTFSFQHRNFGMPNDFNLNATWLNSDNSIRRLYDRRSASERNVKSYEYNLNFIKKYETRGHELNIEAQYTDRSMHRDENINQTDYDHITLLPISNSLQKNYSDNGHDNFILKGNYSVPLDELSKLEVGFKSEWRDLTSQNDYTVFNSSTNQWDLDTSRRNYFDYIQQIHAAYATYGTKFSDLRMQLGLRFEDAITDSKLPLTDQKFKNEYFSYYPSVHFALDLGDEQEVILSYSRRVDRPNNRQINPYVNYADSQNIFAGNPYLTPEYINSVETGYTKAWGKTYLSSSVFYRITSDNISTISEVLDNGVTFTTFKNINSSKAYGIELNGSHPFADWFRINFSGSYYKNEIKGKEDNLLNSSYSYNGRLTSFINFSSDFSMQLNVNYRGPSITLQSKTAEFFTTDLAVKKDFFGNDLSVTFRASDVFNTQKFTSENFGTGFFSTSKNTRDSRNFFLGISYKIFNYDRSKDRDRERGGDDIDL